MDTANVDPTTLEWQHYLAAASGDLRRLIAAFVDRHVESLAATYTAALVADASGRQQIDNPVSRQRVTGVAREWLRLLLVEPTPVADLIVAQQRIGQAQARMGLSMHLMVRGVRAMKTALCDRLFDGDFPRERLAEAVRFVYDLVDLALDTMETSYLADASRLVRSDEAYRLFFLGQNMKAERERQISKLFEWSQQMLVRSYWDIGAAPGDAEAPAPGSSPFVLWLQHKAGTLFEGAPELDGIRERIAAIEGDLLPQLSGARARHADARALVGTLTRLTEEIRSLLASMFDRYIGAEDVRDPVTRLLNRRFFASVVKREITVAQASGLYFALLMVDVDQFDRLRDVVGVESADYALAQVAEVLSDSVRAGDFVFRLGDERFLLLMVEMSAEQAMQVAEGLRARIAAMAVRTVDRAETTLTVSIGVSLFDGHPDYQQMLDRAQRAVAQAARAGGDRCVLQA